VYELPPGHSLTLQDGQLRVFAHWQVDFSRRLPVTADSSECEEEYEEQLSELLRDATRLRLRSDVPVGAYLSGGLDSTVVTALIRQCTDAHLKTFSVTFDDGEFDESAYQKEAVHHLATEHQEVRCSYGQIAGLLPDVIWHTEKPILRTAPVPLFLLSQLVRASGYKVVLTGEGSDEILGGYDIYKEAKVRRFLAAQPESRMRPLLLNRLYPYMDALSRQPDSYRRTFFRARPEELLDPFFSHLPRWDLTSKLKMFFSSEVKFELRASDAYTELRQLLPARYGSWDSFCRAQYLETALLLPGYILSSQGDRVAMAHSVEGRYPFLDHRLVEFAAQLPTQTKMKALNEKYLLKRMAKGLVPENIRKRSKQPYRAPDARSFFDSGTQSARAAYIDELLSPERIQRDGIFDPAAVGKLVAKAKRGETVGIKDNMAVVGILSTQLVFDQFIRNFGEKVDYASN
jgi:asparagine synthase (glutamine-hydrolysing)